jgi:hypothetical protein
MAGFYNTFLSQEDILSRHPGVIQLLEFFAYEHLPAPLQPISKQCWELAYSMADTLEDSAELTTGMRKLLEAKDCFVRAKLIHKK